MQSTYQLVMRSGPSVGKAYPLERAEAFVGRDLNNDIVINDPEISRRHARLYAQGNGYVLEDLGSTNGTFVNGQRLLGPYVLRPGDTITFGERLNMVFESPEIDQDATMVSPSARAFPVSPEPGNIPPARPAASRNQEAAYPASTPAYPPPAAQQPVPSYSGQAPASYPIGQDSPPAPARRSPTLLIVAIIILVLMCLCVIGFLFFAPQEFWCLFPIWPAGACP